MYWFYLRFIAVSMVSPHSLTQEVFAGLYGGVRHPARKILSISHKKLSSSAVFPRARIDPGIQRILTHFNE